MKESLVNFLNPFKALAAKLHPQLPLSKRESERLLKSVTTSFRTRLESDDSNYSGNRSAIEAHLHRVLQNPLFTNLPKPTTIASSSVTSVSDICLATKSPAEWFERQVQNGRANMDSASYCIKCATAENGIGYDPTRTVSLVLEWLWASGNESELAFTGNAGFTAVLVESLVAQNTSEKLLSWLSEANSLLQSNPDHHLASIPLLRLMRFYMRASFKCGGLNLTLKNFNDLLRHIKGNSDFGNMPLLILSGHKLVEMILAMDTASNIKRDIFEEFIGNLDEWSSHSAPPFYAERLTLRHPASPRPYSAIESITSLADTKRNGLDLGLEDQTKARRNLRLLCVEAVKYVRANCDAQEYRTILWNVNYLFPGDKAFEGQPLDAG